MHHHNDPPNPLQARRIAYVNGIAMLALAKAQILLMRQSKEWFITDIISVLLYMTVAKLALGGNTYQLADMNYLTYLGYGLLSASCFLRAFEAAAYMPMDIKMHGLMPDYVMPPIVAWELLFVWVLGPVCSALLLGMTLAILFPVLGLPAIHLSYTGVIGLFLFCMAAASLGNIGSLLSQKWDHIVSLDVYVIMPITLLSGVFFAQSQLASEFAFLFAYNPIFWIVDALRAGFVSGDALESKALISAAAIAALSFVTAVLVFTKGWGVKL